MQKFTFKSGISILLFNHQYFLKTRELKESVLPIVSEAQVTHTLHRVRELAQQLKRIE